jgi:hypothetical protein
MLGCLRTILSCTFRKDLGMFHPVYSSETVHLILIYTEAFIEEFTSYYLFLNNFFVSFLFFRCNNLNVLDLVSQIRDVVLVKCIFGSGRPRWLGFWNEGYMGKGREMGRSVYEQPGNEVDRILSQQGGFQVSKGRRMGSKRE